MEDQFIIQPFDLINASPAEYAAFSAFITQVRAERLPDDPPVSLEENIQRWRSIPSFVSVYQFGARPAGKEDIIAAGDIQVSRTEDNQHLASFNIAVLPQFRRMGLARRLLAEHVAVARRENRRMMLSQTNARVPAGETFMRHLGAEKGLEVHTNQLKISELNHTLVQQWQARAVERAAGFELGFWDGAYPENQIEAIARLNEVMNQQPMGTLVLEDTHFTPAYLRQMEQYIASSGYIRWTFYVYESATGILAGFTDVTWNPRRPTILQQGNTGVFPQYRNKGLGRWLKAVMLAKIIEERPEVLFIRTGNADNNTAMLGINRELGFQPYVAEAIWQVETEKVAAYLK